jgi:hypothetical protein
MKENRRDPFRQAAWVIIIGLTLIGRTHPAEAVSGAAGRVHHRLTAELLPATGTARFENTLTVSPAGTPGSVLHFELDGRLKVESVAVPGRPKWSVRTTRDAADGGRLRVHVQKPGGDPWPEELALEFRYAGPVGENSATVKDGETWVLAGGDGFYPRRDAPGGALEWLTFELTVQTPVPWIAVSQGRKAASHRKEGRESVTWVSGEPMQEIYLIADRYKETREKHGRMSLHTFLLDDEPALSRRYLDAAKKYIDFYQKLLGPYSFPKFALVENSRQTGYGMPSFTLLGSQVIRFPFILHTSYPHEILHNWWGNGVYVKGGNWSEGLTAYLADHLQSELSGRGEVYRFEELKKYLSYVNPGNDFSLADFREREDMATQAVGYGKTLMVFHMLRLEVGDGVFLTALREFYESNRFRRAGFAEIQAAFEKVTGRNFSAFFQQWVERVGAPELALASAATVPSGMGHELKLEVRQKQDAPPYRLHVPVAVWMAGSEIPRVRTLHLKNKWDTFSLNLPFEATAVALDPYNDVFRRLDHKEVPPSLADTYGALRPAAILPREEEFPDVLLGYHQFARAQESPGPLLDDGPFSALPPGGLWVFGRQNQYALKHLTEPLKDYGVTFDEHQVVVRGEPVAWKDHSFVFTLKRPGGRAGSVTWIVAGSGESVSRLQRKLPHYGKYGYLVFAGPRAENRIKGSWRANETDLVKSFDASNRRLPPRPPLVDFKP